MDSLGHPSPSRQPKGMGEGLPPAPSTLLSSWSWLPSAVAQGGLMTSTGFRCPQLSGSPNPHPQESTALLAQQE